jgi:hypothetical protein
MEILLGSNAEFTRNFSHGIIPTFHWIFSSVINADLSWKVSQRIFPMEKFQITMEGF